MASAPDGRASTFDVYAVCSGSWAADRGQLRRARITFRKTFTILCANFVPVTVDFVGAETSLCGVFLVRLFYEYVCDNYVSDRESVFCSILFLSATKLILLHKY